METKVCLVPDASGGVVAPTEIAINQSPVESVNQSLEEVSIEVDQVLIFWDFSNFYLLCKFS